MKEHQFNDFRAGLCDVKQHHKMYKSGKKILFAAITVLGVTLGMFGLTGQTVSAAPENDKIQQSADPQQTVANVSFRVAAINVVNGYRTAVWQMQLTGKDANQQPFTIDVDPSLTADSAALSSQTDVDRGTDHVNDPYDHTLTVDYSQTAALTNIIEAKYPGNKLVWPTNNIFTMTSTPTERTTRSVTIQPVAANNPHKSIGQGETVTYTRPPYKISSNKYESVYYVGSTGVTWQADPEFNGMTIDSSDIPAGYMAENLNISADSPTTTPGESVKAALQKFANGLSDSSPDNTPVIKVPVTLTRAVGEEPNTDPQIRTQVPDAVSVSQADYYDNTAKGEEPDTDPQIRTEVPGTAPSVSQEDYYDNTAEGEEPDTDPQIRTEVPDTAPSVTPDDYYDNTAKGQEPDTDPQIRTEVPDTAPSVSQDDYYDNTADGSHPGPGSETKPDEPTDKPSGTPNGQDNPQQPGNDSTGQKVTQNAQSIGKTTKTSANANPTLPDTGNDAARAVTLGGALTVLLFGAAGVRRKHEHD